MTEQTSPSRRAGLRDEIAEALEAADYRMDMRRGDLADSVLPVLYRAWPWLRGEAEDAASAEPAADEAALRQRIAHALEREDAIHWGYDHGFAASYGVDPETDGFVDAVLSVLPASVDRSAVLRDFLWRLEQSAGDAAAEKFLDDNPDLAALLAAAASAVVVRRATDETPGARHAPGVAIRCPGCRAKGHAVCMDDGESS
jgi:hypothetical protein